jgi:RNA polymerase sigma-70 factor (ECF subfamily)
MIAPTPEKLALVQGLFIQHLPTVRAFVLALVGSFDLVDDIVQETFITVNANASAFKEGTNFRAWVCAIARFKVLQALSSRARKDAEYLSPEVVEALSAHETAEDWCTEQKLGLLASCLEELAPQAHRMVELRYQHAHRPPEIARLMGWTDGAVHVALSRARVFLRDCVKRRMSADNV